MSEPRWSAPGWADPDPESGGALAGSGPARGGPGRGGSGRGGSARGADDPDPARREAAARDLIYRALGMRDHSRSELRAKLARRGFDEELAERMLDKFAAAGLIDDAAFARRWVESRHRHAGRGRRALAQELRTKGIGDAEAASALEGVTREDETERATELVERKLARLGVPEDRAERDKLVKRLVGMLARRGYHPSMALSVALDAVREHRDRG